MKNKIVLLTAMLLASGPVLAQVYLDPVVVRPIHVYMDDGAVMSMSCVDSYTPSPTDVESLLQINDRTQTQQLTNKLMSAVREACNAGVAAIIVERAKSGQALTWRPAYDSFKDEQKTVTN